MQSAPIPPAVSGTPGPSFFGRRIPIELLLGLVLLLCGVAVSLGSIIWSYFGIRIFQPPTIAVYMQISISFSAANALLANVGYFLIFTGILKALRNRDPLARIGPLVILVGGLVVLFAEVTEVALAPSLYPPYINPGLDWFFTVMAVLFVVAQVLITVGLVLSFLAVALGILARPPTVAPVSPP